MRYQSSNIIFSSDPEKQSLAIVPEGAVCYIKSQIYALSNLLRQKPMLHFITILMYQFLLFFQLVN